jgi:YHS domain-containing protein
MENSILKDPVCGMTVTDQSFYHLEHAGHTHFFCGAKCKGRFAADMLRYSGLEVAQVESVSDRAPERKLKGSRGWALAIAVLVVLLALALAYWLL